MLIGVIASVLAGIAGCVVGFIWQRVVSDKVISTYLDELADKREELALLNTQLKFISSAPSPIARWDDPIFSYLAQTYDSLQGNPAELAMFNIAKQIIGPEVSLSGIDKCIISGPAYVHHFDEHNQFLEYSSPRELSEVHAFTALIQGHRGPPIRIYVEARNYHWLEPASQIFTVRWDEPIGSEGFQGSV